MAGMYNASVLWGFELTGLGAANFCAGGTSINKSFGFNTDLSGPDLDRGLSFRYGHGGRNFHSYKAIKNIGSTRVSTDLCDPWILEAIIGGHGEITGSSGSYACTFSEQNLPPSLEIDICQEIVPATTYSLRKLLGCIVKNASLGYDSSSDQPVRLEMDVDYGDEALSAPGSFTAQTEPDQDYPVSFADCTVATSANGSDYTSISDVDKWDLKIDNKAELRHSGGSYKPSRYKVGGREYLISLANLYDSPAEFLQKLYGASNGPSGLNPTAIAYMRLTIAAQTSATMSIILTNVIVAKHSQPNPSEPLEEIVESVDLQAQGCSVVLAGWDNTEPTRYSA